MYRAIPLVVAVLGLGFAADGRAQNPGNNEDLCHAFRGKVVELTEKSLTIKLQGEVKIVGYRKVDGVQMTRTYLQDNNQPPRSFEFGGDLLYYSGLGPRPGGPGCPYPGHLVTDVRVGDSVCIDFARARGQDFCTGITIEARPGGKVPPSQWEKTLEKMRAGNQGKDTRMNAKQAREEQAVAAVKWIGLRLFR